MTAADPSGSTAALPAATALRDRHIVLGVSGSIAAYKAAEVASRLVQAGARVDVAMTQAATRFIAPLTFRSLTQREAFVDMFAPHGDLGEPHVELARAADLMLIAPASASTLARLAHGLAEDFVSLTALATQAPVLVAPAMDAQMWEHAATQANRELLERRGVEFIGPTEGRLASGRMGSGRLVDPETIVGRVKWRLGRERGDLVGRTIVVTAGGNREAIDPVRYIGNRSSGRQGYEIAEAARDRGADVVLISTVDRPAPAGARLVAVESHAEMHEAVRAECESAAVLIMAGAVADFRPASAAEQKIKRGESGEMTVEFVENADIIASIEVEGLVKVAFAAETQDLLKNAARKLTAKGARLIVANDVSASDAGFAVPTNRVTILDDSEGVEEFPLMSKYEVGMRILDRVVGLLDER